MALTPATLDRAAVAAQADEVVDWRHKGMPPALWGSTVADVVRGRHPLSELPTPLLTLSRPGLDHNLQTLARWCTERGLGLAPHGKTTMAPALWGEQIEAGAWAITVANLPQAAVARRFGVNRVMIANSIVSPLALRWIVDEMAADPGVDMLVWADDPRTVAIMDAALAAHAQQSGPRPPLPVLVERGATGGRTGTRSAETWLATARAVASSPHLSLAGVSGYEGAVAHDTDDASLEAVHDYLEDLAESHAQGHDLVRDRTPVVTAGGSAYFDVVADVLAPLAADGADVVLRSGAYITHDDGFYRHISPLGEAPRSAGPTLRSAMHGWVRVSSQPEPGLALVDAGKRDLPFDEGLPEVQLRRGRITGETPTPVIAEVTAMNDQHTFVRFDGTDPEIGLEIGDELRLGLSHPCTAFDKWTLVPVIDDEDAADPVVVDLVRTWF